MITPEIKDKILNYFISIGVKFVFNCHDANDIFGISEDEFEIILNQFEDNNLLSIRRSLGGPMFITLTADTYDIQRHGGFTGKEIIFQQTIDKLYLEVEQLQKSFPDKMEQWTTILSNLSTLGSFFIKHK